jgi:hypothetical protein
VNYANYYGLQDTIEVSVVPNIGDEDKTFTNLIVEGNHAYPESVEYRVQGAKATQQVHYAPNDIRHNNANYTKGELQITIPKIDDVHHQDIEQKISALKAGARSLLRIGSRVKGKYMIAKLTYSGDSAVEIKSISTIYKTLK